MVRGGRNKSVEKRARQSRKVILRWDSEFHNIDSGERKWKSSGIKLKIGITLKLESSVHL